jgi:hypothetical protein
VSIELARQWKQPVRHLRLLGPVGQHLVLPAPADLGKPLRSLGTGNQNNIRNIARAKAATDAQMNPF